MSLPPAPPLSAFPARAVDKVRYADTDRQGHVNNALFATFFETGRVELLYAPDAPLAAAGASWVLARIEIDLRAELRWPGEVHIGTEALSVGRSSVTLHQGLYQGGVCAATARTVVVQIDGLTGRGCPLSPAARARLEALRVAPQGPT